MAQKIDWTQINTRHIPKNKFGEPFKIVLGDEEYKNYLESIYVNKVITKNLDAETYEIPSKTGSGFTKAILWNPVTKEVTYGDLAGHNHDNIDTLNKISENGLDMTYSSDIVITTRNVNDFVTNDKNYIYDQGISSKKWIINHPLRKEVSVTVKDSAGSGVNGKVTRNDGYVVIIEFNAPFSGKAALN